MSDRSAEMGRLGAELETLMRELVVCYEQLRTIGAMRHESIRGADAEGLGACVRQENELIQRVAEIEKRRIQLVGRCTEVLGEPERGEATMGWIAERAPEPLRGRLLSLAGSLRELLRAVSRQNRVSRETAEALASHMRGLIAKVAQHLNHAQVYGRAGVVEAGPRVVSALDITS
jgi:hypothetical protein